MSIAFFDLDGTLLACNSGLPWLREQLRAGEVGLATAAAVLARLLSYGLGFGGLEQALVAGVAADRGGEAEKLRGRIAAWYERDLRGELRPGGRVALAEHRARGDRTVLLTGASQFLSECVARELGLDGVVCTVYEIDEGGLLTGRISGRPCMGEGKLEAASAYVEAAGIALSQCAFYGDSMSDVPVLEAVGAPVAVNPDVRLARLARARGWPVVDWGGGRGRSHRAVPARDPASRD